MISRNPKLTLKITAIIIAIVGLCGYSLFQARFFLYGPSLVIEHPKQGETVNNSILEIRGSAHNISEIQLNNKRIYTEKDGNFKEKLMLSPGYNIMEVAVKDKFGREIKKTVEVVFDAMEQNTQAKAN